MKHYPRPLSWLAAVALAVVFNLLLEATGLCLDPTTCTSVTGTVYAPNSTNPVYNALVYVPNGPAGAPTYGVTAITAGVHCDQAGADVTGSPLMSTFSSTNGSFTLNNMPAGTNVPLVIQIGRWRRKLTITNLPTCTTTALTAAQTRLPTTEAEFDPADNIPLIAISTGGVDAMECALLKIGIAGTAFSDPAAQGGTGRVRFYTGVTGPGVQYSANTPSEALLYQSLTSIEQYDMVFFACQGSEGDKSAAQQQVIINYANAGGRIFATHFSYVWLFNDAPFSSTATWDTANDGSTFAHDPGTGLVNETFPTGLALAQWLKAVGASSTLGQVSIGALRDDFTGVVAPAELWLSVNDTSLGTVPMLYSFDTPVGAPPSSQCGRVMFCDFHAEDKDNDPTTGLTFPSECTAGVMTPQEKLLEFMLFDLDASSNPNLPSATTLPATGVAGTTATLNGTVNLNNVTGSTYFQYGLTTSYGGFSATTGWTGGDSGSVAASITGLTPGTTYHYQFVADNAGGMALGGDQTFVTATPVVFDLTGAKEISGGAFQFGFTNVSGLGFTVYGSTNLLSTWTNLGAAVESPAGSGNYQFTDTQNTNQATKFYRVVSP